MTPREAAQRFLELVLRSTFNDVLDLTDRVGLDNDAPVHARKAAYAEVETSVRRRFAVAHDLDALEEAARLAAAEGRQADVAIAVTKLVDAVSDELTVYDLWEASIYSEHLGLEVVVPLLMVTSSIERVSIAQNISVERMPESLQLARSAHLESHTVAVNTTVLGAATHALVLRGLSLKNSDLYTRWQTMADRNVLSKVSETINSFFDAFRIVSDIETGYGQVVMVPVGWADSWRGHLTDVSVLHAREYPEHFEDFGWLSPPKMLGEEIFADVGRVREFLVDDRGTLAARRLSMASLRSNATDAIVDAWIGLESLLTSSSDRGETTFKLSLRLAGLCKLDVPFEGLTPVPVKSLCKNSTTFEALLFTAARKSRKPSL